MTKPNLFDHYSLRARLQPALLALLPTALGALAWSQPEAGWISALWTLFGTTGFTFFLAMLARNRGKQLEPGLWESWGGAPTTQLLRHRGPGNRLLKERWHRHLGKLLGKAMPTAEEEQKNPADADEAYAASTRLLIQKRRDTKADPLIYKENVNYGFCRNLYAMKPIAIPSALLGIGMSTWAGIHFCQSGKPEVLPWVCATLGVALLMWWIFVVGPGWVQVAAFAYAERLFESTEKTSRTKRNEENA